LTILLLSDLDVLENHDRSCGLPGVGQNDQSTAQAVQNKAKSGIRETTVMNTAALFKVKYKITRLPAIT
jgi:hypothetical protein